MSNVTLYYLETDNTVHNIVVDESQIAMYPAGVVFYDNTGYAYFQPWDRIPRIVSPPGVTFKYGG